MGRPLAQSFGQGRGREVVVGVVETVGLLARSIGQGSGHGLWAGGGGAVNGVVGRWLVYSFGESEGREGLVEVVEGLA